MADKLFVVDPKAVKHDTQTDTQHPLSSPLPEQWERWVASVQGLPPRVAWVERRGREVVQMRTAGIAPYRVTPAQMERLPECLAHGVPWDSRVVTAPIAERPTTSVTELVLDWETTPAAAEWGNSAPRRYWRP